MSWGRTIIRTPIDFVTDIPTWQDFTIKSNVIASNPLAQTIHGYFSTQGRRPFRSTGFRFYRCADTVGNIIHALWEDSAGNIFISSRLTTDGEKRYIERSTDKGATWAVVISDITAPSIPAAAGGVLDRCFIDLGANKLLFVDYSDHSMSKKILYSSDAGANWATILEIAANGGDGNEPIRHFHGGVYDSVDDMLYIFTGDANDESTILVCNDVADFVLGEGNWVTANWKEKWGLLDQNDTYSGDAVTNPELREGLDADYVLNDNLTGFLPQSQRFRVLDFFIETHTNSIRYGYWGVDTASGTYGGTFHKANLTQFKVDSTKQLMQLKGLVKGEGWYIGTSNNEPVIGTISRDPGTYPICDSYVYIYGLTKNRREIIPLARWKKLDDAVGAKAWPRGESDIFGGLFVLTGNIGTICDDGEDSSKEVGPRHVLGQVVPLRYANKMYNEAKLGTKGFNFDALNLLPNPYFTEYAGADFSGWTRYHSFATREGTIVEPGRSYSAKVLIDSSQSSPYLQWQASEHLRRMLQSNVVTLSGMVYLASTLHNDQLVRVRLNCPPDGGGTNFTDVEFTNADFDDTWHFFMLSILLTADLLSAKVTLYAQVGAATVPDPGPVYFSSMKLVFGRAVGGEGIPSLWTPPL